ncbi:MULTISPECIES: sensor histidine kinase KdpD [unclassified Terrabacter]|uniref:sensor histidine kinase n=1 Tax=unclassified Terrabacter TaxID=2630222 RepID=UPI000A876589|nr:MULTISPECIES: ATP-binding protein [unclassified Terrabacter]
MCDNIKMGGVGTSLEVPEPDTVRVLLHDLRGPLSAILLLSESSRGDVEEKLERITEQASWLLALVESSLEQTTADDVTIVDALEVAEFVAGLARVAVTTSIAVESSTDVWALARPIALSRALGCVVDNAVRAAGPDGHVTISVRDVAGAVHLTVVDDGPGLGRVTGRTSIGLVATRAMVASCKGSFRLANGPDGGATADISLPSGRGVSAAS